MRVYPKSPFASLPQHDKFFIKERLHDPAVGCTRVKLVLKSCSTESEEILRYGDLTIIIV